MRRAGLGILTLALGQIPLSALAEDPPQFELKWGTDGKGAGQFDEVIGIAVSPDGGLSPKGLPPRLPVIGWDAIPTATDPRPKALRRAQNGGHWYTWQPSEAR